MSQISRSALVPYSAEQMFCLVDDFARYPEFIDGCVAARVLSRNDQEVLGELTLAKRGMKQSFQTKNQLLPHESIHMRLVEGPFKRFEGIWQFSPVGAVGCRVEFTLEYEFANRLIAMAFGPVISRMADRMVAAFSARAEDLYD